MKRKNARVGLRVQMKSTDKYIPVGALGTITELSGALVGVYWDDDVHGWGSETFGIPIGHGWNVRIKDLRKVKE